MISRILSTEYRDWINRRSVRFNSNQSYLFDLGANTHNNWLSINQDRDSNTFAGITQTIIHVVHVE